MRGGVVQLHRWGLLDDVIAAGTPPIRRTTFRFANDTVPITIKPSYGVDALYAPRRTVLDPILVDAARRSGVDVRFGVTVTDVTRGPHGGVEGVATHTARTGRQLIGARIVVGADGIRSTIADRVDAGYERVGSAGAAVTYGYWSDLDTDGYEWNFRPNAATGVIPTNGDQACVFASATPARIGRGGLDVLRAVVAESSPELAERLTRATPPPGTRTFAGRPGHIRRSWGNGWALVGDAGYFKDPIAAHGLTDAFRDAELLANAIADIVVDGADPDASLAAYQATRDTLSIELFDVADTIAGNRWTDTAIPNLLRRLNAAMADELEALASLPPLAPARLTGGQLTGGQLTGLVAR
jgi:2-polyprenyl-6-methoxyphenol hydroxylase-like FAD-dependent oxidoreductase